MLVSISHTKWTSVLVYWSKSSTTSLKSKHCVVCFQRMGYHLVFIISTHFVLLVTKFNWHLNAHTHMYVTFPSLFLSSKQPMNESLVCHVKYTECVNVCYCIQKNIERHTAHTIVSWPNPKQWVTLHTSDLMMIIRQSVYILSIISKEMGKLETHIPTFRMMDNWENMLNLTHTLDELYLTGIL